MCKRVATLKSLSECNLKINSDRIVSKKVVEPCILSETDIVIDDQKNRGRYQMKDFHVERSTKYS